MTQIIPPRDFNRRFSVDADRPKLETICEAIDLTKKDNKPIVTANFYQETLPDEIQHKSVIKVNPIYASPQPSTSNYAVLTPLAVETDAVIPQKDSFLIRQTSPPLTPITPITPILNIDFTKNLSKPEIKVLDANAVRHKVIRQNLKAKLKKNEIPKQVILDNINTDLQIDEDYDT